MTIKFSELRKRLLADHAVKAEYDALSADFAPDAEADAAKLRAAEEREREGYAKFPDTLDDFAWLRDGAAWPDK